MKKQSSPSQINEQECLRLAEISGRILSVGTNYCVLGGETKGFIVERGRERIAEGGKDEEGRDNMGIGIFSP